MSSLVSPLPFNDSSIPHPPTSVPTSPRILIHFSIPFSRYEVLLRSTHTDTHTNTNSHTNHHTVMIPLTQILPASMLNNISNLNESERKSVIDLELQMNNSSHTHVHVNSSTPPSVTHTRTHSQSDTRALNQTLDSTSPPSPSTSTSYISADGHLILPARSLLPILNYNTYTAFMYEKRTITAIYVACVILMMIGIPCGLISLFSQGTNLISLYILLSLMPFPITGCIIVIIHWFDKRLILDLLQRFEVIYLIFQVLGFGVSFGWTGSEVANENLSVYRWTCGLFATAAALASIVVLLTDAAPRVLLTRRIQIGLYGAIGIIGFVGWLYYGILTKATDHEICLFFCSPSNRLVASFLLPVSMFYAKFAVSLLIWPKSAVLLKSRIDVVSETHS